jgi:hypothetical protein
MVRVGVGVNLARDGGDDVVLLLHAGKSEVAGRCRGWHRTSAIEMVGFCHYPERFLENLPEFDRLIWSKGQLSRKHVWQDKLTVSGKQEMGGILSFTPLDLVNLLLDFEGFEIIELGFVRLEFGVEFVLASFFLFEEMSKGRKCKPARRVMA